jgi:hypothetical protein
MNCLNAFFFKNLIKNFFQFKVSQPISNKSKSY